MFLSIKINIQKDLKITLIIFYNLLVYLYKLIILNILKFNFYFKTRKFLPLLIFLHKLLTEVLD